MDLTQPPSVAQPFWIPYGLSPFNVAENAIPPGVATSDPRVVMVNSGALIPQKSVAEILSEALSHDHGISVTKPGSSSLSPPQTAALGIVGTVAAVAAGGSLYAFLTNQGISYFWARSSTASWAA